MERDGFHFDFLTQRFLETRWETELGKQVYEQIKSGIGNSAELRGILDPYVLVDPENSNPHPFPYYPPGAMVPDAFWVLTSDDLRGIRFYHEDFAGSLSLEKKQLAYSSFYDCKLNNADLYGTDFSYARLEKCTLDGAKLARSGGFSTRLIDSSVQRCMMFDVGFRDCDFSGTDFTGTYYENVVLEDIIVNYKTKFDLDLPLKWKDRTCDRSGRPDLLRAIRLAYEKSEIWSLMDLFLAKEKTEERQAVLWPNFKKTRTFKNFMIWSGSLVSGWSSKYATAPGRVLSFSLVTAIAFAAIYLVMGMPTNRTDLLEGLYFSLTTFVSLGDGSLVYAVDRPYMRILTTIEAWLGVVLISLFVVVLARKLFRK